MRLEKKSAKNTRLAILASACLLASTAVILTQSTASYQDSISTSITARGWEVDITVNGSDGAASAPIDLLNGKTVILDHAEYRLPDPVTLSNKGADPVEVTIRIDSSDLDTNLYPSGLSSPVVVHGAGTSATTHVVTLQPAKSITFDASVQVPSAVPGASGTLTSNLQFNAIPLP